MKSRASVVVDSNAVKRLVNEGYPRAATWTNLHAGESGPADGDASLATALRAAGMSPTAEQLALVGRALGVEDLGALPFNAAAPEG